MSVWLRWCGLVEDYPHRDFLESLLRQESTSHHDSGLNPLRFYGRYGPDPLDRKEVRAVELSLIVDDVTPAAIRLRLEGFARFGGVPPAAVAKGDIASLDRWGYDHFRGS